MPGVSGSLALGPQLSEDFSSRNPFYDAIAKFLKAAFCLGDPKLLDFLRRFHGFFQAGQDAHRKASSILGGQTHNVFL